MKSCLIHLASGRTVGGGSEIALDDRRRSGNFPNWLPTFYHLTVNTSQRIPRAVYERVIRSFTVG
jgi:hypothetical protein